MQINNTILENYLNYLKNGVEMNKVEIKTNNGMSGIFATDYIKSGEIVIKLNHKYAISAFKVFENKKCLEIMQQHPEIYPTLQQIANQKSDFQVLILYLIIERNGEMKPVFDMTPQPLCILDCPHKIPFTYLRQLQEEFNQEYHYHKETIIKIGVKSEDYDWAYRYCVNRRLSVNNDYPFSFLVPMVDMINHGQNKAIFGLENNNQQEEQEYYQNNYRKYQYIKTRKYWLLQEDQDFLEQINITETQTCSKQLNILLNKLFQELILAESEDMWQLKLFSKDDSEEDDNQIKVSEMHNSGQIQPQVNDDYLRDYYDQQLEETDHDWYNYSAEQPAFLTARVVDDIEKGEEILNLYGCLGNEHLLMYYGFAMNKNKYDRVKFRIHMNCNKKQEFVSNLNELVLIHYVSYKDLLKKESIGIHMDMLTTEFRLKKSSISLELLRFIRTYTSLLDGKDFKEGEIIQLYRSIIEILLKHFNSKIQEADHWGQQLENYRLSKVKILNSHLNMVEYIGKCVKELPIKIFKKIRPYLKQD